MKREHMEMIDALLTGEISQDDFAELQRSMREDPVVLKNFLSQSEIDGRIHWQLGASTPKKNEKQPKGLSVQQRLTRMKIISAGLAAAAAVLTLFLVLDRAGPAPWPEAPAVATGNKGQLNIPVACLTNSLDAEWVDNKMELGSPLVPGSIHLAEGTAEITFDSGARVVIKGPAELDLISAYCGKLQNGTATVHIPSQAVGFRLDTPSSTLTEQNTSFAIAVEDDGASKVHVIDGLVEVAPRNQPALARVVKSKESLAFGPDSEVSTKIRWNADGSPSLSMPLSETSVAARYLHWPLDELMRGSTPEKGQHDHGSFPAKANVDPWGSGVAGLHHVKGRWGNALQFNGRGAYLSSDFPGIAGSGARTVTFWVRIPPDAEGMESYSMVTWGSAREHDAGEKWQVAWNHSNDNSGVTGAIRTEFGGGFVIGSTDLRDGRWHHVATVFLGGDGHDPATRIRHYVDGRLERVSAYRSGTVKTALTKSDSSPAVFGKRLEEDSPEIGFKGVLDELYLFPAALNPEQIDALYLNNTPPDRFIPTSPGFALLVK